MFQIVLQIGFKDFYLPSELYKKRARGNNSINLKRKTGLLCGAYGDWQFEEGHAVPEWAYFPKKGDYICLDLVFLAEILLGHIGGVSRKNRLVQIKVGFFVAGRPEPHAEIPKVYR